MFKMGTLFGTLSGFIIFGIILESQGAILSKANEFIIQPQEQAPLTQFKEQIGSKLPEDYMQKDVYLIKWLRANNLKVNESTQMIMKMLEWRKEFKMDTILNEDFTELIRELPFNMDAVDFEGRPVAAIDIADWDSRHIILTGRRDQAIRYIFRNIETLMRKAMKANDDGFNVSTAVILANFNGFNNVQHACSECIPIYRNLISALENNYPGVIYKLLAINTPHSFYPVFRLLSELLSRSTRDSIKFYGTDKRQWQPDIRNLVARELLEPQYGGTKKRHVYE